MTGSPFASGRLDGDGLILIREDGTETTPLGLLIMRGVTLADNGDLTFDLTVSEE